MEAWRGRQKMQGGQQSNAEDGGQRKGTGASQHTLHFSTSSALRDLASSTSCCIARMRRFIASICHATAQHAARIDKSHRCSL
jgi:hypothetical protein